MARGRDNEFLDQLAKVPLFDGLSQKSLKKVCESAKEMHWSEGERLTCEATRGSRFHLLLDGEVAVEAGGHRRTTLGPGAMLGEIALIDGQPRTATVTALTPVRTLSLASWNFRSLLRDEPTIAEKVMVGLARRIRELEQSPLP